ncbi:hypothetical protein INT45_001270 [Circinella minor]|uniref:NmrA-like domain-containing protein n=1 Tax=Circinella minor TaxID=1195481 RepID=A0A8H7RUY7_9FUNG|nr:hypothetical protein INT45_001270 [Circinella minor]
MARLYVIGGTGTVGSLVVQELVKQRGTQVTVYARSPAKVLQADNVTIVQGDLDDLTPFEKSISGHDRLFLLVPDRSDLDKIMITISKTAYVAGIKQILDISSTTLPSRTFSIDHKHHVAEEAIYAIPKRSAYISIRPTNFMTNTLFLVHTIKNHDFIMDSADPEELQEWISPFDIAQVAARILQDPIEKHGDAAYELIGDLKTPLQRAFILSNVLGRTITYKQVSAQELYDHFLEFTKNHNISYFLSTFQRSNPVTRGLSVLLGGRIPESYETWATKNKQAFLK